MRRFTLPSLVTASVIAAGCAGGVGYSATVSNAAYGPDLVYAAPGVQVIADYDEPIFFVDGFYWRLDGGTWYRSGNYSGGWAYAPPPPAVLRIERPRDYVHYRPTGWTNRRAQRQQPIVRDHREDRPRIESRPPIQPPPQRMAPPQRTAPPQRAVPPQRAAPPRGNPPSSPGPAPRRDHRK